VCAYPTADLWCEMYEPMFFFNHKFAFNTKKGSREQPTFAMMTRKKIPFDIFINHFPEIDLPVTLSSGIHLVFSRENKPLPQEFIQVFLEDIDQHKKTEFTEFVPCFRLPHLNDFIALVFWRADLMEYEYILVTFEKNGRLIDKRVIGGTKSNGETMLSRVATIDEDLIIFVAEGIGNLDEQHYEANSSNIFHFEILPSGDILQMINEN
jgi:hypothetical protein